MGCSGRGSKSDAWCGERMERARDKGKGCWGPTACGFLTYVAVRAAQYVYMHMHTSPMHAMSNRC